MTTDPESMRVSTPFGRFYSCDGKLYPSVTTILSHMGDKSGLDQWRKRVGDAEADKITKQSTDRGTELHLMIEHYLKGESYEPKYPFVKWMFPTVKQYLDRITNVRFQEHAMFSHKIRCAGTVDCVSDFDHIPSIVDFKNSNSVKDSSDIKGYFIQTALYGIMLKEMYGLNHPQLVIIMATEKMKPLLFVDSIENHIQDALTLIKDFNKKYKNELSKSALLYGDREA